jgi:hypothetical protein
MKNCDECVSNDRSIERVCISYVFDMISTIYFFVRLILWKILLVILNL